MKNDCLYKFGFWLRASIILPSIVNGVSESALATTFGYDLAIAHSMETHPHSTPLSGGSIYPTLIMTN